jgi:murein DD-endopeptidase MepM/ murein hydrolase activator NlpD
MTRDRLRPAVLVRKVLLPPVLAGAAVACLLAALAVTAASGSRADAGNPLAGATHVRLVLALSADLEGTPEPRDIRRARRPLPERLRVLARHPYFRLYVRAQHRFDVSWVLVAAVDYQETAFQHAGDPDRAVMAIAAQLRGANASRSLGRATLRAVAKRYGATPAGRLSTAMVVERARAWRLLGTIPRPGRGELATPVAGVVGGCGYFGCPRPGHLHNGVDFLAPTGTPVHAADAGRVALAQTPGESGGYGNFVCLQHRPHLATCYAHLSAVAANVVVGAHLRRGEVVGLVGSTGSSSAPHLHFEARLGPAGCQACAVDPLPLLSGVVPQSRVPRMLRASASASSATAPALAPAPADPIAPAAAAVPPAPSVDPAEVQLAPRTSAPPAPAPAPKAVVVAPPVSRPGPSAPVVAPQRPPQAPAATSAPGPPSGGATPGDAPASGGTAVAPASPP